jgi:3-oxoacyl-(acyl-carrier-protein) synthase
MNANTIVISGLGMASKAGSERDKFIQAAFHDGEALIENIDMELLPHGLTSRQLKKFDRFTILAISATKSAMQDACLNVTDENRDKIGLLIGNTFGGWSYVENQMYELCAGNMSAINPYVATAWFPAAPQGEISILEKIGGYSKSFSADNLSSAYAIEHAYELLVDGKLDIALTGGSESPVSDLITNSLIESGDISVSQAELTAEGAGMLVIEKAKEALIRNKRPYAKINGFTFGKDQNSVIAETLAKYNLALDEVEIISSSNPAINSNNTNKAIKSFSRIYGKTYGAEFVLDVISACLLLADNSIKHALVIGHSKDGNIMAISLSQFGYEGN